jgi:hypothetical protein
MKDETKQELTQLCPICSLELFWDDSELSYLCPARFDGTHERELAKQAQLHQSVVSRGQAGGIARSANLDSQARSKIASSASKARWSQRRKT